MAGPLSDVAERCRSLTRRVTTVQPAYNPADMAHREAER
jgi:hypothetical protein